MAVYTVGMFDQGIVLKMIGALGLFCVTVGVFYNNNVRAQDVAFIIGGAGLLVYSASLHDPIFVPLQIIFILAACINLCKRAKTKKRHA